MTNVTLTGTGFQKTATSRPASITSFQGHDYSYVSTAATWTAAKNNCTTLGGHLVTLTSPAENQFVYNLGGLTPAWIGFTDAATEGSFLWINGDAVSYTNWQSGYPNGGASANDAQFSATGSGTWVDAAGTASLPYVCEFDSSVTPRVFLVGASTIEAYNVRWSSATQLLFDINLTGAAGGKYFVEVINPDGLVTVSNPIFSISPTRWHLTIPIPYAVPVTNTQTYSTAIPVASSGDATATVSYMEVDALDTSTNQRLYDCVAILHTVSTFDLNTYSAKMGAGQIGRYTDYPNPTMNLFLKYDFENLIFNTDEPGNGTGTNVGRSTFNYDSTKTLWARFYTWRGDGNPGNTLSNVKLLVTMDSATMPGAYMTGNSQKTLQWTVSPAREAAAQKIYKASALAGPYMLLTTINDNTTSTYQDVTMQNGATSYYKVTAQTVDGTPGADSNVLTVALPNTLQVTAMSPAPNSSQTSAVTSVTVTLSGPVNASGVHANSVKLVRAGLDGLFDTADDVTITPASLTVVGTNQIKLDLTGITLPPDKYRVTLSNATINSTTNLYAYWPFDEGTGTTAADVSGNAHNLTLANTAWATGVKNGALAFNGNNSIANLGLGNLAIPWSLSFYVNRAGTNSGYMEMMMQNGTNNRVRIEQYNGTKLVGFTKASVADYTYAYSAPLNTWAQLTMVATSTTSTSLYVNGTLLGTVANATTLPLYSIGATTNSLKGSLDEMRVYSRALSAAEIYASANGVSDLNGNPLDGEFSGTFPSGDGLTGGNFSAQFTLAGPVVQYSFNEGSGTVANDSTGNGNTGTLTNGPAWVPGVTGTALSFDGVDDVVNDTGFNWPANQPVTVAFWNYVATTQVQDSCAFGIGGSSVRFQAHVPYLDKALYWDYGNITGSGRIVTDYTPYLDKWTHVALVSAGAGGNFKAIYLNGVLIASNNSSDGPQIALTGLQVGHTPGSATGTTQHRGKIDDFRIYNRVLSAGEILTLGQSPPVATPDSFTSLVGQTLIVAAPGVLINDVDPGGFGISAALDSTTSHGVLTLNTDGSFSYSPAPGFAGTDTFTYHAVNSKSQTTSSVTVSLIVLAPMSVTAMSPAPNSSQSTPASILVTLSSTVSASSVSLNSLVFIRAGPDGMLNTADDVSITPTAVSVVNGNQIKVDLPAPVLADQYQFTLYGTKPSIPNLAAYFAFDETTGTNVSDSSGNGNTATLTGNQGWGQGVVGGALTLDTSSNVTANNATLGSFGASDFSVTMWMKSQSSNCVIIGNRRSQNHAAFWTARIQNSGTINFEVDQDGNGTNYNTTQVSAKKVNDGAWHNVAITRSGAVLKVYVDGSLDVATTGPGTANVTNGSSVIIGANVFINEPSHYAGSLDEIRIFNRAISLAEINALINHVPITDANGFPMDGEYPGIGGGLPSGDGTAGGDFVATFSTGLIGPTTTTVTQPASITYGASSLLLSANVTAAGTTVGSGTVTFQLLSAGNNVGTSVQGTIAAGSTAVTYTIPSGTAPGLYSVSASYNGVGAYQNSSDSSKQLTITTAPLVATPATTSKTYGGVNPTFTGTLAGVKNGENITATFSTIATASGSAGTYSITATLNDPNNKLGNYTVTLNTAVFTVNKAPLSVSADSFQRAYGVANPTFTGTLSGVVNGDNITASYSTTATINSPVGTYSIIPKLVDPGSRLGNYTVTSTNGILNIGSGTSLLVVTPDSFSRNYGDANPTFTGTIVGLVNGDNITATYSTTANIVSGVGNYTITATLIDPGNKLPNYTVNQNVGQLAINKASLSITGGTFSRTYGAANPTLTGSIAGLKNGDNISATYATSAVATSAVSPYAIVPTPFDPGNKLANYTLSQTNGVLNVTAAPLTVTPANATRQYGLVTPTFTGTVTGVLNGDGIGALYATTATAGSPVGTYPITATLTDPNNKASNYAVTLNTGTLTISVAPGLVVTPGNASRNYGAANPAFTGSVTGILNSDNITANYISAATPASAKGNYTITATLIDPTNKLGNYAAPTFNTGTLTIGTTPLTVVAANSSRAYGANNPTFTGNIVGIQNGDSISATYASSATSASVVGTYSIVPTLVDPGSKLSNYSVTPTNGTLTIGQAALSVTAADSTRAYGAANPAFTGTIIGIQNNDSISATYASTATVTSPVGQYAIAPTLVDPSSKLGNYAVTINNGKLTVGTAALTVTPSGGTRVYGSGNPDFSGTIVGVLNNDVIAATYATVATPASPVGNYSILATLVDPGNKLGNYALTSNVGTLSITPAALSVTASDAARVYHAPDPAFTGTIVGIQNSDPISATYAPNATANSPVGAYTITPALLDPNNLLGNYTVTPANGTLRIGQATPVIAWSNPARIFAGVPLDAAQLNAAANDAFTNAVVTGSFAYAPLAGTVLAPGLGQTLSAAFTPDDAVNYTATFATVTLDVDAAILPAITSATTASGTMGVPFSYTTTASGSAPMTFKTGSLPAGLTLAGGVISGTPTVSGVFDITLTSTNYAGSASQSLRLVIVQAAGTNHAPVFTSRPTSSANPATTGTPITLTATATDADGDALDYTWDFGDGSSGTGATVTKIFPVPGAYVVKVVVFDGQATDSQTIVISVNDAPPAAKFAVTKVLVEFNFTKAASDSLALTGTIPLPADFSTAGKTVRVLIGDLDSTYTLDAKGTSTDKSFSLKFKSGASSATFTYTLKKQSLFASFENLGFSKTTGNPSLILPVVVVLDGQSYLDQPAIKYSARSNKKGPVSGQGGK